mmetsp:Transcript_28278/g.55616  ORF Transcript_28278/g.55616 Transcript_28278/m.55616 type:complete len:184 (-) Transcript_28278:57-608(-)
MRRTDPAVRFSLSLRCYSFHTAGKEDKDSYTDKVILPNEAFRYVQLNQVPFPLYFKVANCRRSKAGVKADQQPVQYCGVLEFSAPEEHCYLPFWMMENIGVKEGGKVKVTSVAAMPPGTHCVFQPHDIAFVDVLKEMGPKHFLESSLRHYSVLRQGNRIVVRSREGERVRWLYGLVLLFCLRR